MQEIREKLQTEYDSLVADLAKPDAYLDPGIGKKTKRQGEIKKILEYFAQYEKLSQQKAEATTLLGGGDLEISQLALAELEDLDHKLTGINQQLEEALAPQDPNDEKNAIIEIRAGAGGDEASLFGGDLYRMYARWAERHGHKTNLISENPSEAGGFKEIIFEVKGESAYSQLKYESGVHRVQRIPVTESSGRIHTSTATVAIMPEAEETDIDIKPEDLRIDVFRASGHGGQSVNTTDSAVRITHLPTNIVVSMQDEKSQIKNREKAMNILRSRLLAYETDKQQQAQANDRRSKIGTGDRSEKIRTYNFPQDRITDHRIGYTRSNLPAALDGEIDDIFEQLRTVERQIQLQ
jgi:peptide chain release factor 1